jgi:D-xylonolactonase
VDILNHNVHRLSLADGSKKSWTFDTEVTSIVARERGGFVGTIRDGFAFIDLESSTYEPITLPEAHLTGNRFNDAKVDGNGRFWGGSMDDTGQNRESGSLYRLDPDLHAHKIDDTYIINNGPAFNNDNKIMYHTDSVKKVVYAFNLNPQGNIFNKRRFIQFKRKEEGAPDGMTVDSENCIWICHFGGSRITRFSPEGDFLQVIPMPVPNITSCTFAGPELDTLYITTARISMTDEALKQYPLAGSLFSIKPGVTGLPTPQFSG